MQQPAILARGHWPAERVHARWHEEHYEPPATKAQAADAAIAALRERGSPSHDGLSARLVAHAERGEDLMLELQPVRWALRLVDGDASLSMAALAVTRAADGRWLAGRRASWLSSWAGRWALGAGGAVDVGESPAHTLVRELDEEWAVSPSGSPSRRSCACPTARDGRRSGLAARRRRDRDGRRARRLRVVAADVADWPDEADEPLRRMADAARRPRRMTGAADLPSPEVGPFPHSAVYTVLLVVWLVPGRGFEAISSWPTASAGSR